MVLNYYSDKKSLDGVVYSRVQ